MLLCKGQAVKGLALAHDLGDGSCPVDLDGLIQLPPQETRFREPHTFPRLEMGYPVATPLPQLGLYDW